MAIFIETVPAPEALDDTVQVRAEYSYGTDRVYPDNATARVFTTLTGRKTFTAPDLDAIRQLGYRITMRQESSRLPDGYGHADII